MKIRLTRRAATIVAAATLTAGAAVAITPTTASASTTDMGIRLSTTHNVGVYGYYKNISNASKVAPDLSPYNNDGIETDCWSNQGQDLGYGPYWYHTISEYYNSAGQTLHVYSWTYAPYVDNGNAMNHLGLQYCNY
ncbi:hypothetical protein [Streptomyces sp. NRRL WC-3742]|uniref:hypothetical protein n=1 Tax=Streptomyces sp. NRRL WC-3742 TaxID=1463934 RepID=UPI0004CBEDAC|nr:hypothetical protein [Streptomyces sp. NRRL WC-3742]